MDVAGLDTSEAAGMLKQWQDEQEKFLGQTGLRRQYGREQVSGFGYAQAKAAKDSYGIAKHVANIANSGNISSTVSVIFDDNQFGRKIGKHAQDFGLSASTPEDRAKMKGIIKDIVNNADEKRTGDWRGQEGPVLFYIKGDDVVILKENHEFITVLKEGVKNARVKKARGE